VTNRTLGTLLRTLVGKHLRDWDLKLCHAEFAYNRSPSLATKHSPFECVYGTNPLLPVSLTDVPYANSKQGEAGELVLEMEALHKQIHDNIMQTTAKYKQKADRHIQQRPTITVGDMVWVHLRKERFPHLRKNKLMPRAIGPFPVTRQFGTNAFEVQLPAEYNISHTFNIGDLTLFTPDQELRTILPQEGGVETNVPSLTPTKPKEGNSSTDCTEGSGTCLTFTSAPNSEETHKPTLLAYKGLLIPSRSCDDTPIMRETTQGSRIQKGAHFLKQTANYTKTSAPNLGGGKSKEFKAMDTLREGLGNYTNQETSMESPRKSVKISKD
jgi:hypothetical protein